MEDVPLPAYPLLMLLVFAFTLFTSATLLFLVQPMMGKMILPLLGGSPAVWDTCMGFFQAWSKGSRILVRRYTIAQSTV